RALRAAKPLKFLWLVLQSYGHRGRIELSRLVPRRHRQPHFIRVSYLPRLRCEPAEPTTSRAVRWQFSYRPYLPGRHVLPQNDCAAPSRCRGRRTSHLQGSFAADDKGRSCPRFYVRARSPASVPGSSTVTKSSRSRSLEHSERRRQQLAVFAVVPLSPAVRIEAISRRSLPAAEGPLNAARIG